MIARKTLADLPMTPEGLAQMNNADFAKYWDVIIRGDRSRPASRFENSAFAQQRPDAPFDMAKIGDDPCSDKLFEEYRECLRLFPVQPGEKPKPEVARAQSECRKAAMARYLRCKTAV